MSYTSGVTARFNDRAVLEAEELYRLFALPPEIDVDMLTNALQIFLEEYDIPAGSLRPDDSMRCFVDPPRTKNPISWFFARASYEDRLSELSYHLGKARHRAGLKALPAWPATIRDYVIAYAGKDQPVMLD
jgi:hypothetical protein